MRVRQDDINRLTGRLGIGLGKRLTNGNQLYSSLSVLHEFNGKENITANSLNYSQDMSGTWYELIVGINAKMSNHSTGYLNIEKLFGDDVHSNWQINGGCRWSF